jgi:hypothetical protein
VRCQACSSHRPWFLLLAGVAATACRTYCISSLVAAAAAKQLLQPSVAVWQQQHLVLQLLQHPAGCNKEVKLYVAAERTS